MPRIGRDAAAAGLLLLGGLTQYSAVQGQHLPLYARVRRHDGCWGRYCYCCCCCNRMSPVLLLLLHSAVTAAGIGAVQVLVWLQLSSHSYCCSMLLLSTALAVSHAIRLERVLQWADVAAAVAVAACIY
jgi:hypothetical protein